MHQLHLGIYLLVGAALISAACSDTAGPPPPPDEESPALLPGLVVSEPQPAMSTSSGALVSSKAGEVAYISAEPGTFPDAVAVQLRNLTTGGAATSVIPVGEGGFDPVAVPASPGDELELSIRQYEGQVQIMRVWVPPRRPPRVVRTSPPKGRTDVALSIQALVVFTEPVDPQSVTPASIRLLRSGVPVTGAVAPVPGSPFRVTFTPQGPLDPQTEYELVISREVRDLDGEVLPEEVRVQFRTAAAEPLDLGGVGLLLEKYNGTDPDASDLTLHLWTQYADGTGASQLTASALWDLGPASSPDGSRIAFSRNGPDFYRLHLMNPDGSGITPLMAEYTRCPSWSPDGSRIAFQMHAARIASIGVDGTGFRLLYDDREGTGVLMGPAWSPDGRTIAFFRIDINAPEGFHQQIWAMDADGGNHRPLRVLGWDGAGMLAWSRDGTRLLFQNGPALWSMNADGSNPVRLIDLPDADIWWTAWSPDRRFIAGVKGLWTLGWERPGDIYLFDIETGAMVQVTTDGRNRMAHFQDSMAATSCW